MRRQLIPLAGAVALIGLGALSVPLSNLGRTLCPFALMTGIPCPGCGLTRSIAGLARGDLAASLSMHPFGAVLVMEAIVLGIAGYRQPRIFTKTWAIVVVLGINFLALLAIWWLRWSSGTLPPI